MPSERAIKLTAEIMAEVRANTEKLTGCSGPQHKFVRVQPVLFSKYRCEICGGIVEVTAAHWYQRGIEHAKRI